MNVRHIAVAGAFFALAAPLAAVAAPQNATLSPSQAVSAALNDLSSGDRTQVRNILSLLQNGQIDAGSAAAQIDAVLSTDESKAVLGEAAKVAGQSDEADAGVALATLVKPPSK